MASRKREKLENETEKNRQIRTCRIYFKGGDGRLYEGDLVVEDHSVKSPWFNDIRDRLATIDNIKLTRRPDIVEKLESKMPRLMTKQRYGHGY